MKVTNYRPAVPAAAGVYEAMHIWKILGVENYRFNDPGAYTEKQLSCNTWEGCTEAEYEKNSAFYKHLNNMVLQQLRKINDQSKIIRIIDRESRNNPTRVTKICKSDRRHAILRQKHILDVASGCIASAVDLNERLQLKQNVGQVVMGGVIQRLPDNYSSEEKKRITKELTVETALEAGKLLGRKETAASILEILDMRPALISKDDESKDDYSGDARIRRSNFNKDDNN